MLHATVIFTIRATNSFRIVSKLYRMKGYPCQEQKPTIEPRKRISRIVIYAISVSRLGPYRSPINDDQGRFHWRSTTLARTLLRKGDLRAYKNHPFFFGAETIEDLLTILVTIFATLENCIKYLRINETAVKFSRIVANRLVRYFAGIFLIRTNPREIRVEVFVWCVYCRNPGFSLASPICEFEREKDCRENQLIHGGVSNVPRTKSGDERRHPWGRVKAIFGFGGNRALIPRDKIKPKTVPSVKAISPERQILYP